jgi:hypothetical protein
MYMYMNCPGILLSEMISFAKIVMQLILVKWSGLSKKQYLIKKFHDIRLSYYLNGQLMS